jgi:hypothetical protein
MLFCIMRQTPLMMMNHGFVPSKNIQPINGNFNEYFRYIFKVATRLVPVSHQTLSCFRFNKIFSLLRNLQHSYNRFAFTVLITTIFHYFNPVSNPLLLFRTCHHPRRKYHLGDLPRFKNNPRVQSSRQL